MVTIRRDLKILENQRHLKRYHKGAVAVQPYELLDLFGLEKENKHFVREKSTRAAAELISMSDNNIIDSGTTPPEVV